MRTCSNSFRFLFFAAIASATGVSLPINAADNVPPAGYRALFNGKDLAGWHGVGTEDPRKLAALSAEDRTAARKKSLEDVNQHWTIQNGDLVNDGFGLYLTSDEAFGDYEMFISYKTVPKADSGIYLKGTPQVQIWDSTEEAKFKIGADKGSGGLWNNRDGRPGKHPLVKADRPFGEWNDFRIRQVGAKTTVFLNGKLVVDHATLENYFDPKTPLIARGPVQLQTHGGEICWKNLFVREIPASEANALLANDGFTTLFDGKTLNGWTGAVDNYEVADGAIRCKTGKGGVLHTKHEYGDFIARLEFKLPPGGNNGLAIRYPGEGDAAYTGMCELQVLDNDAAQYAKLDPRQYHGSAYGMGAAARGFHRPIGEWNYQEVTVIGSTIKVELNGNVILETDLSQVKDIMANSPHPGKDRTQGYFGFAGHSDPVEFRNVRIKELSTTALKN